MPATPEQFEKIKQIVDRVLASPRSNFYSRRFAEENFSAKDLEELSDIQRIPRLTRQALSEISPFDHLYMPAEKARYIRYTSGTSQSPALLLLRPEQRYHIPGKRPLILTVNNQLDHYFASAPRRAEAPYFPPLIHSNQSLSVTVELAKLYNIDAIIGLASKMITLGKELPDKIRGGIQYLFIQGERYTLSLSQELKELYPEAEQDSRYGMTEVGLFGYQCKELQKQQVGQYHCESDYFLEIANSETGNWVEAGQEGEILITELYESPHQIIRYRTGDAGRILSEEPCQCGAQFTFEVTGRIDHDIIKIAGGIIRTDEIECVLRELNHWFEPDFRGMVEVTSGIEGIQAVFTIALIPKSNTSRHPMAMETISQDIAKRMFMTPTKTLADFLKEGRIARFEVVFVEKFPPEIKAQRLRFKERGADSPKIAE